MALDTPLIVGLISLLVVGFFAYQWWARSGRRLSRPMNRALPPASASAPTPSPTMGSGPGKGSLGSQGSPDGQGSQGSQGSPGTAASMRSEPPSGEYPDVPGQTQAEMRNPEPLQQRVPASQQQAVDYEGNGPANFETNLRRPEQLFHQPQTVPKMQVSEVDSGRAAVASTPLSGNQQAFSPEMAQNGGAMIGNSVFAFDGMEPTGFANF